MTKKSHFISYQSAKKLKKVKYTKSINLLPSKDTSQPSSNTVQLYACRFPQHINNNIIQVDHEFCFRLPHPHYQSIQHMDRRLLSFRASRLKGFSRRTRWRLYQQSQPCQSTQCHPKVSLQLIRYDDTLSAVKSPTLSSFIIDNIPRLLLNRI